MNDLWIENIAVNRNSLKIRFEATDDWKQYLYDREFCCEYNIDISGLPDSLAVVPLLGNLLPIAWLHNLSIHIDSLDKSFYDYLPMVLEGYKKMYPDVSFYNNLSVKDVVDNKHPEYNNEVCFFSGGVDAYYTFFQHKSSISAIATVWGADIALDDYEGWRNVDNATFIVAERYHIKRYLIKSNFKTFINSENLTRSLFHSGWGWWHEFQHGMGLITLMAPVAYSEKLSCIYIASSYTADVKNLTCASDPSIDNYVRFNQCQIIHDGFESNRQQKIQHIVDYSQRYNLPVDLRVCWVSRGGKNCCKCEKCCRTMTALLLEDANINQFGFKGRNATSVAIARNMKYRNGALSRDWDLLYNKFHEKYTNETIPKEWVWFYQGGTDSINNNIIYRALLIPRGIFRKIKSKIKKY